MRWQFRLSTGEYDARASFALVTLGYSLGESSQPGVTNDIGFFIWVGSLDVKAPG